MKLLYLLPLLLAGCVQEQTTKRNDDGSKSVLKSWGLSDRAGAFADAYARHRLRMPQVQPTK